MTSDLQLPDLAHKKVQSQLHQNSKLGDFPGRPAVTTLSSTAGGLSSIPGRGIKLSQAPPCSQKKEENSWGKRKLTWKKERMWTNHHLRGCSGHSSHVKPASSREHCLLDGGGRGREGAGQGSWWQGEVRGECPSHPPSSNMQVPQPREAPGEPAGQVQNRSCQPAALRQTAPDPHSPPRTGSRRPRAREQRSKPHGHTSERRRVPCLSTRKSWC